ncbi:MAG: hypothetical protein EXQ58_08235 [Acidobacteria bacterium]|nr:hypothetical protein [Acidobacteriota bacterium]
MRAASLRCSEEAVEIDPPRALFNANLPILPYLGYSYDVSSDGKRLLLLNPVAESAGSSLTVHLNRLSALHK